MEVVYSSLRWPPALYRAIKAESEKRKTSVNAFVCEMMAKSLNVKEGEKK